MALQPWDDIKLAAHPSDLYEADENEKKYLDGLYDKLKQNKEPGKDPADVFRDGIQGELFSRKPDRGALKPWTEGINPWDTGGGKMKKMLQPFPALQKIILRDAMSKAPKKITGGGKIPNTIRGTTHIDSPQMDRLIENWRRQQGPQLPSWV